MSEHRDPPATEDLPALYVNPWGLLRSDLLAVLATLRLGIWQMWRRNRQGDLPRPPFWPQALAGWFWPVLLGVLLGLLVAAGWGLGALQDPPPAGQLPSPESALGESVAEEPTPEPASTLNPPAEDTPVQAPPGNAPVAEPEPALDSPPDQPDPLLLAFAVEQGGALLQAARVREPDGDLELVLDPSGWQRLPAGARQRLAEQWQLRAESLGYGRLWLLDGQGLPLARSARVGSGMILLAPLTPAHAP